MILPETYIGAFLLAVLSLVCWGSWANTYKLARRQRFELFYWDCALGVMVAVTVAAFTFGSLGFELSGDVGGFAFLDDFIKSSKHSWAFGFAAGAVLNLGLLVLVASMSLAGMSLAFPVALGLTAVLALLLDYIMKPHVHAVLLFSAMAPILASVVLDVVAYRGISLQRAQEAIKSGRTRSTRVAAGWKGTVLAVVGGLLIAMSLPLVDLSRVPETGMGPYAAAFMLGAGVFASTFVYNLFFMNLPVQGEPVELLLYFRQPKKSHLLPFLGGVAWGTAIVSLLVASSAVAPTSSAVAEPVPLLGPATGHVVVLGAALLNALWGLLLWKEFADAPGRVRALLALMLILLTGALALLLFASPFAV